MSDPLMKAILSMDAYNRGYDASIKFGNLSGNNSVDAPNTTQIGKAVVTNTRGQQDAQDIGFYAIAYDLDGVAGGEKVISYRGTDDFDGGITNSKDAYHGWSLGGGIYASDQGVEA